jgi:mannose-1-phosphate guanylyltransferase
LATKGTDHEVRALLLAAGLGTRLKPLTDHWPKCLMPIRKKALLEIWLDNLHAAGISKVLINLHYHAEIVREFLSRPKFSSWVESIFEDELLGTAGTLRENLPFFSGATTLMAHADNLCICDFQAFIGYHFDNRPKNTVMTMMTFTTPTPQSCGIVELDASGVVQKFHEKAQNPPGNLANAAIYLIEPEVLSWIKNQKGISDFSTQVLPQFMGRIATWNNTGIMRDIGTVASLQAAQSDLKSGLLVAGDEWQNQFMQNPLHQHVETLA